MKQIVFQPNYERMFLNAVLTLVAVGEAAGVRGEDQCNGSLEIIIAIDKLKERRARAQSEVGRLRAERDALQKRLNVADQQVDDLQVGLETALSLIGKIFIAGGAPLDSALDEWVESLRRDAGLLYLLLDGIEEGRVVVFKKEPDQTTYLEDRAAIAWALGADVQDISHG